MFPKRLKQCHVDVLNVTGKVLGLTLAFSFRGDKRGRPVPRTITISLLVSLTIGTCAYIGLLPLLATLLLPGVVLGLLIGIWRLQWIQWAFTKHQIRKRFFDEVYRSGGFVEDEEVEDRVTRIGQRVALAAGRSIDAIEFCVVNDQYIYAYVYPLINIVAISKGMYEDFRNDNELASVLAHEVAHIYMGDKTGHPPATFKESRSHESNADELALEFVRRAGFDPRAFAQCFWRYMGYRFQTEGKIHNEQGSTHPSNLQRIAMINVAIGKLGYF